MKVRRDNPYELGIPPVKDIFIQNSKENNLLTSTPESFTSIPFTDEYIAYNLGESVASDFRDLQRHAVNMIADDPTRITPRLASLAINPLPYLRYGPYRIKISYNIPGVNKTTTTHEVEIFNRIPDNE
jgi:hypothetical protein